MINQLLNNLYVASFYATIFASTFILLRKFLIKAIGARWNYYLWFILFISWFAVWLPISFFPEVDTHYNFHVLTTYLNTQLQNFPISSKSSYSQMIFTSWVIGALCYSIYILFTHFKFVLFLKSNSKLLTDSQKKTVRKGLVNKDLIPLSRIYTSTINSPIICHIIKSKIYLPDNFFNDYTPDEQRYILQHECVHYQRCDLISNTAMLILMCLNWFNPIILMSYRYFRCAQELSCDAIVSHQFSPAERKAYAYALLKSVFKKSAQAQEMSCWWNTGSQLKERCSMLKVHVTNPMKNFLGIIIFAAATSIAVAAPNLAVADDMKFGNSTKYNISFSINGICSTELGNIEKRSIKIISTDRFNEVCKYNPNQCVIDVYTAENCTGRAVANMVFDKINMISTASGGDITISGNGSNVFFNNL